MAIPFIPKESVWEECGPRRPGRREQLPHSGPVSPERSLWPPSLDCSGASGGVRKSESNPGVLNGVAISSPPSPGTFDYHNCLNAQGSLPSTPTQNFPGPLPAMLGLRNPASHPPPRRPCQTTAQRLHSQDGHAYQGFTTGSHSPVPSLQGHPLKGAQSSFPSPPQSDRVASPLASQSLLTTSLSLSLPPACSCSPSPRR